ncbi:hypothetical protein [Streptomyces sp. NPDC056361]|uniref:hypothetical protein n=1 Tax=Streptomyces sp. NPDC056361 TaxID=3345795 RepID=UPI0035D5D53B
MTRPENEVDQIVFRWDSENPSGSTGFGPVAWSGPREEAENLFRISGPVLRASGDETRPALIRLQQNAGVMLIRRTPFTDAGGGTSVLCHALVGSPDLLEPSTCLGLHAWDWEGADAVNAAEARGRLPVVPEAALVPTAVGQGQWELDRSLADVSRELVGTVAELLRHPDERFTVLDERGDTALGVLWGLHSMFGAATNRRWTFATHDTAEVTALRFVFVGRWSGAASRNTERRRVDPLDRYGDRAEAVATGLVRHHLRGVVEGEGREYAVGGALHVAASARRASLLDIAARALDTLDRRTAAPPPRKPTPTPRKPSPPSAAPPTPTPRPTPGDPRTPTPQPPHPPSRDPHAPPSRDLHSPSTRDPHAPPSRDPHAPSTRDPHPPAFEAPPSTAPPHPRPAPGDPYLPSSRDPRTPPSRDPHPPASRDPHVPSSRDSYAPSSRDSHPPASRDPHAPSSLDPHPQTSRDPYPSPARDPYPPTPRDPREPDHPEMPNRPPEPAPGAPSTPTAPTTTSTPTAPSAPSTSSAPAGRDSSPDHAPHADAGDCARLVRPLVTAEWSGPGKGRGRAWGRGRGKEREAETGLVHKLPTARGPEEARGMVARGGSRELLDVLRRPLDYAVLTELLGEIARRLPSWEHPLRRELCEVVLDRELWAVARPGVRHPSDPSEEQRAANAAELYRWAVRPVLAGGDARIATVAELLSRLRTDPEPAARQAFWLIVDGDRPGLPDAVWLTLLKEAYGMPRTPPRPASPVSPAAGHPDDPGNGYTRRFLTRAGVLLGGLVVAIALIGLWGLLT